MAALITVRYSDGTPRKTGSLLLRMQGTSYQLILKDPSARMELSAVGLTVDDAYAALELLLGMERPPWGPMWEPRENSEKKPRKT